jgi:hypothetical protein
MTPGLLWLDSHVGSMEAGIELINNLGWNISVKNINNKWFVLAGDQPILSSDAQEEITTFLYGMSLAYSILPDDMIKDLKKEAGIDE